MVGIWEWWGLGNGRDLGMVGTWLWEESSFCDTDSPHRHLVIPVQYA